MTIPEDISQTIVSQEFISRKLLTIEFRDADIPPLRVLENENFDEISINGESYLGAPLKISEISRSDDNDLQRVQVEISNLAGSISSLIGLHGDVLTGCACMIEEVFLDNDFKVISSRAFPLFIGRANNLTLSRELLKFSIDTYLGGYSNRSPNMTYGVNCQWRKFKDIRCAYKGSETSCDKTLTRCSELGNLANFGGFPSIPSQQVIK